MQEMFTPSGVPANPFSALLLAAALGGFFAVPANAETLFSLGVSETGGWYDANKAFVPNIGGSTWVKDAAGYYANSDSNLCWAAAASNMLQWWQDRYAETFGSLPAGTPNGLAEKTLYPDRRQYQIFNTFADNWTNQSGYSRFGISWWLDGRDPIAGPTLKPESAVSGGFFAEAISSGKIASADDSLSFRMYSASEALPQIFSDDMRELFGNGAVLELGVRLGDSDTVHGITCWGVELDETTDFVTKIYYTDSDDNFSNLAVSSNATYEALEQLGYLTAGGEVLREAALAYTPDGKIQFNLSPDYPVVTIVDRTAFTFMALIPEPSAFGVLAGIAALALAGTRRRRSSPGAQ